MGNKDKPWFNDQCRHTLGFMQKAHLHTHHSRVNWEEFVRRQVRVNETYSETKRGIGVRSRDVLINAESPHKW